MLQVLQALDRYHDDRAMAFVSVLHSLVVSTATWHNDRPGGESQTSSKFPAVVAPRRPSSEAIRIFVRERLRQRELSERLMDVDEDSEEMKDSEAGEAAAATDEGDEEDANMMCDDLKQEPPDHIKLVMEVITTVVNVNTADQYTVGSASSH